jgi:hypothetical protein
MTILNGCKITPNRFQELPNTRISGAEKLGQSALPIGVETFGFSRSFIA